MNGFDVRFTSIRCADIKGRLIRNPNYGGPELSLNGWTWRKEISKHGKEGFQGALEASVRDEGVRNPILVWSLPEGIFLTFGGSRVRACVSAEIEYIPAIINDYTGDFAGTPIVRKDNIEDFFIDPPRDWEFGEYGFDYHYNLERARRQNYDESGLTWLGDENPEWLDKEFPWL
jgi:hypothetical protein